MGQDYSGSVIVCRDKGEIILKSIYRIVAVIFLYVGIFMVKRIFLVDF